jgi:hypothetical protein
MAVSAVPSIEADSMAGEKTPHNRGHRYICGSQQKVKVIRYQRPGKTGRVGFGKNIGKSFNEVISVNIILEYFAALYTAANNMMKSSGGVYSGFSWHNNSLYH